jgi:two-component system sensor histidine kinase SenX3
MGLLHRRREPAVEGLTPELADARAEISRLRQQLDRQTRALDNLPIGVVLVDSRGSVVGRNAMASGFLGAGHGGVLVDEAVGRMIDQATREGRASTDVRLYGPPLRVVTVTAHQLADGGVLALIDDVSERERLEAVRTDFVANISHELKTPVGAIALLAETIVDEEDPEVVRRLANRLVDEAHRAASSIDDLLELSRIELGGAAIRERVTAVSVLRDAVVRSLAAAEQRQIRLDLDEPDQSIAVWGDRRQLVSAISNLIDNAVKYSEQSSSVQLSAVRDDGSVSFVVTDHGIGIPTRDLDRIFERFYRVDRARSRDTGGTGLGLAIVNHVAVNHDGRVSVRSVEGEGSSFILSIPEAP